MSLKRELFPETSDLGTRELIWSKRNDRKDRIKNANVKYQKTASFLLKCNQNKSSFFLLTGEILATKPTKASRLYFACSPQVL